MRLLFESGNQSSEELALLEAEVVAARYDLEDLTVRAPSDSQVTAVNVRGGEYAMPENPVVNLQLASVTEEK